MSRPSNRTADLGFRGLLDAGWSPEEAREIIRADLVASGGMGIIRAMESNEEGRAALAWSRQQWEAHGQRPPWEEDPE